MDVSVSDVFLRAVPLRRAEPSWPVALAMRFFGISPPPVEETTIGIPPMLLSGLNELQLRFDMRPLSRGDCVAIPADVRAAIEPGSSIDISRAHRFTLLPNLGFLRLRRLPASPGWRTCRKPRWCWGGSGSGRAVRRPRHHRADGRRRRPAGDRPGGGAGLRPSQVRERDLLVIGTLARNAAVAQVLADGPVPAEGNRLALALPDAPGRLREMFLGGPSQRERDRAAAALAAPPEGFAVLFSREIPLRPRTGGGDDDSPGRGRADGLGRGAGRSGAQPGGAGDLAVLSGGRIESFRTGPLFERGTLLFWLWPRHYLGDQPLPLLLLMLLAAVLLSRPLYRMLRRRAERRLQGMRDAARLAPAGAGGGGPRRRLGRCPAAAQRRRRPIRRLPPCWPRARIGPARTASIWRCAPMNGCWRLIRTTPRRWPARCRRSRPWQPPRRRAAAGAAARLGTARGCAAAGGRARPSRRHAGSRRAGGCPPSGPGWAIGGGGAALPRIVWRAGAARALCRRILPRPRRHARRLRRGARRPLRPAARPPGRSPRRACPGAAASPSAPRRAPEGIARSAPAGSGAGGGA